MQIRVFVKFRENTAAASSKFYV